MAFKPTAEQQAAINIKTPVLVSAAAGSGKTAVLVERVIKMLTDSENPVMADRLLIVTFTNAAAAEMLSRIEARLYTEYENNPDSDLIARQRYLIKNADICTIDSFCIRLVRENFAALSVEPDFRVTDDNSLFSIRSEVLSDIISGYLQNPCEELLSLLEIAGCRYGEENLIKLIDGIYLSSLKKPFPTAFINSLKVPYNAPFESGHIWQKYAFSFARDTLASTKKAVADMAEAALYSEAHDKATVYAEVVSNLVFSIENAVGSGDWDEVYNTVRSAALGKLPPKCGDKLKELKTEISADIDRIKGYFYAQKSEIAADIRGLTPAVNLLFKITEEYSKKLFDRLKHENIFSFDDIEQMAVSMLLTLDDNGNILKTKQADEIISRYDQVLVDEFQDVNDLQNTLFEVLSNNSEKLFIVGDVKQSIYAFRGSNPDIFLQKKDSYKDYLSAGEAEKKKVLLLNNYRSRQGICDCVNFFFESIMTGDVGRLVYNKSEQLEPAAEFPQNDTADTDFLVIDKVDDESGDSVIESEAAAICDYIKETMASGNILRDKDGALKKPNYGDFCILLATLKEKSGIIADVLNRNGIPAKVNDGSFFESTEILTALALLHTVDNPQNDVYLLKTLMSPVYNFTAEEMANVRTGRKNISLYSALCDCAYENEKASKFLSEIRELRKMSCMLPTNKFVAYVIDKTDMINIFYSLSGGDIRAENLMMLMHLADEYTGDMSGSVFGFLRYIESLPQNAVKPSGSDDGECVKIMSIHRSKGLQFPICIVAGLSHKMNKQDGYESCLFSGDYGIGFKYFDSKKGDKTENIGHRVLSEENLKRTARERLRLLYVALTRAEEKLCLICCLKNAGSALLSAAKASNMGQTGIGGRYIMRAQNSAQYILAAALLHPDADILRSAAECKVKTLSTNSKIAFRFIDAARNDTADNTEKVNVLPNTELAAEIKNNIEYEYPYKALYNIPAKTSVSMMANKAEAEQFALSDRPAFMEKDGVSAAGRGIAVHRIMQYIDFSENDIESEIARLLRENRITETQAAAADRDMIKRFWESDIHTRILNAKEERREMRFLTELPVSYYGASTLNKDKFIVQGAVDLCFLEEDGIVVLDFKTDRVKSVDELKEKYAEQLNIYSIACQKIFGVPVKEKIIYSFCLSDTISI